MDSDRIPAGHMAAGMGVGGGMRGREREAGRREGHTHTHQDIDSRRECKEI